MYREKECEGLLGATTRSARLEVDGEVEVEVEVGDGGVGRGGR